MKVPITRGLILNTNASADPHIGTRGLIADSLLKARNLEIAGRF